MEPRPEYIDDNGGIYFIGDYAFTYYHDGLNYRIESDNNYIKYNLGDRYRRRSLGLTNEKIHKCG